MNKILFYASVLNTIVSEELSVITLLENNSLFNFCSIPRTVFLIIFVKGIYSVFSPESEFRLMESSNRVLFYIRFHSTLHIVQHTQ